MKVGVTKGTLLDVFYDQDTHFEIVELPDYDSDLISEIEAIVAGRMSNEQLEKASKLKDIFIPFTGKNGFDLEYVEKLGINIHVSQIHSRYVAERALALALALLGKITFYDKEMHEGRWGKRNFGDRVSWDSIFDKKIGIYGYGEIGKFIHKLVLPFTDKVYAYNRSRKEEVNYVDSLSELINKCDIIFVATPISESTKGSVSKELMMKMKNKYLINVG